MHSGFVFSYLGVFYEPSLVKRDRFGRAIDRLSLLSRASANSAAFAEAKPSGEPALLLRAYSTVQAASPILGDGLLIPRRQPGSGLFNRPSRRIHSV